MTGNEAATTARKRISPILRRGQKVRVLVVDDSVVIRRLVTHALQEDPALEVVGSAADGALALQRIPQLNPDVVTLDVEMPVMDGLQTLREIRKLYPQLCVVMFSTLTARGATTTLDALLLGADDYVTKPSNEGSLDLSLARLRTELIPKVKQFFHFEQPETPNAPPSSVGAGSPTKAPRIFKPSVPRERKVVAIGVSTGGPIALADIIPMFPANFPLPIVLVQHMPPVFTQLLAERLQSKSQLHVAEAVAGAPVEAGTILIAPGNYHMRLSRNGTQVGVTLDQGPPENSCRPAVDVLFRSVSEVYGGATIGVILTGMGYDGLRGAEQLKGDGAYIIAQDRDSSVVWGMPGAVVEAGLADATLTLKDVVPEILRQAN
jgi:two-component system, chemotaxis family, protein-glutamate methylesterase/glutaminase